MLVLCSGMKRSGSTWQFNAVCRILEKKRNVVVEGFLPEDELFVRREELIVWAKDSDVYHVVKTHAVLDLSAYSLSGAEVLTTYTFRDIRDAAVSIKRQFGARGKRLIAILDEVIETHEAIQRLPNALIQRYEHFTRQQGEAIRELSDYLETPLDDAEVGEIITACDVEAMRKVADQEASGCKKRIFKRIWHFNRRLPIKTVLLRLGFPLPLWIRLRNWVRPYDNRTLLRPDHVSKEGGASGVWRGALEVDEINMIEGRYGKWLKENNYELRAEIVNPT